MLENTKMENRLATHFIVQTWEDFVSIKIMLKIMTSDSVGANFGAVSPVRPA